MIIVVDENVPDVLAASLRDAGHDVARIAALAPSIPDHEVLKLATDRAAVVLTFDKDFGDLVFRDGLDHTGVVLVRLRRMTDEERAARIVRLFDEEAARLPGAFTVVSNTGTRIRE